MGKSKHHKHHKRHKHHHEHSNDRRDAEDTGNHDSEEGNLGYIKTEEEVKDVEEDSHNAKSIRMQFAIDMVQKALGDGYWESHEIAVLVQLAIDILGITSNKKIFKFIDKCAITDPQVFAELADRGVVELDPHQIFKIIISSAETDPALFAKIEDALEQEIVPLDDSKVLEQLSGLLMVRDFRDRVRYGARIIFHAKSKRQSATIMAAFTSDMAKPQAAQYICEIISHPTFQDINGKMQDFMPALHESCDMYHAGIVECVNALLPEYADVDDDGNIVDADVDENGNLSGFIVGSDVEDSGMDSNDSQYYSTCSVDDICTASDGSDCGYARAPLKRKAVAHGAKIEGHSNRKRPRHTEDVYDIDSDNSDQEPEDFPKAKRKDKSKDKVTGKDRPKFSGLKEPKQSPTKKQGSRATSLSQSQGITSPSGIKRRGRTLLDDEDEDEENDDNDDKEENDEGEDTEDTDDWLDAHN